MVTRLMRMLTAGFLAAALAACMPSPTTVRAPAEPEPAAKTDIQHWRTANGAKVYFVAARGIPMVDVRVVFNGGSARDGGKDGLAQLTATMLDKGAAGMDANTIAMKMEGLGAQLGAGSARDMAWVTLRSLSDDAMLEPALQVFEKVLTGPDFPAKDLQRERQRMMVAVQAQQQRPRSIADRAFYKAVFPEHPYGSPETGTAETLESIQREDVTGFYQRYYVAANAVIALVGDMSRQQAEAIADRLTRGLAKGEPAARVPDVAPLSSARQIDLEHPSSQSSVMVGAPGMRRGDPDYFTLYVGNHILGGSGLVSRISDEIREKRGLSYSAYSYFYPMAQPGPFIMGLQTRNDQVDEALKVLKETLVRYREEGPTEAELVASKKNITGGFALRVDSNKKIVEYLAVIGFYDLPLDYLDTFNSKIEAVTLDRIRDAFQRRVDPERMVTVVVGQR